VLAGAGTGVAHEARPGFLELRQTGPETYSFLWKKPTGGEVEIQIAPVIPKDCRLATSDRQQLSPGAFIVRGTLTCAGGLAGKTIVVAGLEATITDVLVRLHHADGRLESHLLRPTNPSVTLGGVTTATERALGYVQLGVQHILLGIDHLLFVLGLLLIVADRWMLLKTITAFTLAHSITLALATLGVIHVPGPPVEALIALSIVFVAAEVIQARRGKAGLAKHHPWIIAFGFGLLHGLGFAGALAEVGLPDNAIPTALLFFNVGVEVGQLIFIAIVLAVVAACRWLWVRLRMPLPKWLWLVPPYAIGGIASYWVFERIASF
jgi:hydrogenase/urease accessory protein HupE